MAWQRAVRGYDDETKWGLCYSLPSIIIPALDYMIKRAHGHPCDLKSMKDWKNILKKMRQGFILQKKIDEGKFNIKKYDEMKKKVDEGLDLFAKYYDNLWD